MLSESKNRPCCQQILIDFVFSIFKLTSYFEVGCWPVLIKLNENLYFVISYKETKFRGGGGEKGTAERTL